MSKELYFILALIAADVLIFYFDIRKLKKKLEKADDNFKKIEFELSDIKSQIDDMKSCLFK